MRKDFLSNERPIPVTERGRPRSRALHSNHVKGHVWVGIRFFYNGRGSPLDGIEEPHDGGRGDYRLISPPSVWAFAPFTHNNAIGPEVCSLSPYRSTGTVP